MSDSANPIIAIRGLTHRYGEREALRELSLSIHAGEIFGLLGPNGSGKTTLFRILSTLIAPTSGSVEMLGLDVRTARDAIRTQIGVVFQSPSLDKELTAAENLRYHGHLYGLGGAELEERIDAMLGLVGLAQRPREFVKQFSGGMRRRVELAKGLITRPRILLMDEPSTGLDPGAQAEVWQYLRRIRQEHGVTIVLATHLMDEAEQCDRLAILDGGRLAACGSPAELKGGIGVADVITIVAEGDAGPLAAEIRESLGVEARVVGSVVRIERSAGHEFIPRLVETFAGRIRSVSLGRPTLHDVFLHVTGHTFAEG